MKFAKLEPGQYQLRIKTTFGAAVSSATTKPVSDRLLYALAVLDGWAPPGADGSQDHPLAFATNAFVDEVWRFYEVASAQARLDDPNVRRVFPWGREMVR
jgi:hypothetical protein